MSRKDWGTPQWLFDRLHREFHFTVDAAAQEHNAKLQRYWRPQDSGLEHDWAGERVFCNPPYGPDITAWLRKAHKSRVSNMTQAGHVSVLIVPVRSETEWWHTYVMLATEIRFIRGRVHFENPGVSGHDNRPVFASAVVVFRTGLAGLASVRSMTVPRLEDSENQMRLSDLTT